MAAIWSHNFQSSVPYLPSQTQEGLRKRKERSINTHNTSLVSITSTSCHAQLSLSQQKQGKTWGSNIISDNFRTPAYLQRLEPFTYSMSRAHRHQSLPISPDRQRPSSSSSPAKLYAGQPRVWPTLLALSRQDSLRSLRKRNDDVVSGWHNRCFRLLTLLQVVPDRVERLSGMEDIRRTLNNTHDFVVVVRKERDSHPHLPCTSRPA
jgi:hypothetical protein